jgi:hypothetical protein
MTTMVSTAILEAVSAEVTDQTVFKDKTWRETEKEKKIVI